LSTPVHRFLAALTAALLFAAGCDHQPDDDDTTSPADDDDIVDDDSADDDDSSDPPANSPPALVDPGVIEVDEGEYRTVVFEATDADDDEVRIVVRDLPRYAWFDPPTATLTLDPQHGDEGEANGTVFLTDGQDVTTAALSIDVTDVWTPNPPTQVGDDDLVGWDVLWYAHDTDASMRSPDMDDAPVSFAVSYPDDWDQVSLLPVVVRLHGMGGAIEPNKGLDDAINVWPVDDPDSYWYGYSDALPAGDPADGTVQPYTERRVLYELDWVLEEFAADPHRVYVEGTCMGSVGALGFGLRHTPRFAGILSGNVMADRRLSEDAAVPFCESLWGTIEDEAPARDGTPMWEHIAFGPWLESHRALAGTWVRFRHGKDDSAVQYSQLAGPSPETGRSFFESLEHVRAGYQAAWDGGSHATLVDPVLGLEWWGTWDVHSDPITFLALDTSFPAFSDYSYQPGFSDPGTGVGDFGDVDTMDDNSYDGDRYGVRNRHLRWDSTSLEDTEDRWSIDLWIYDVDDDQDPPTPDHPELFDDYAGSGVETVSVTPRRTQAFWLFPGEAVTWESSAGQAGTATADDWGAVTVEGVEVSTSGVRLTVVRAVTVD